MEHETLALATLLNLDYKDSSFAGGALLPESEKEKKLEEYMRDFWLVLEENSPGSIPPGIIFLPGDRIKLPGFGWAPVSWMEAQGVDHPDPISVVEKSARLEPQKGGLLVEFPGFLLHFQDRNAVLGYTDGKGCWFASDSSLSEWYHIERAYGKDYTPKKGIIDEQRTEDLAVILSRPRPREIPEIGLLVEIHKKKEQRQLGKDISKRIFSVYILGRVNVSRETDEERIKERRQEIIESRKPENRGKIICGEALDEDQQWYVDSRTVENEELGDDSTVLTRPGSEANMPRSKPYPMRGAAEVSEQIEADGGASQAGTETPEPAPSTHAGSSMLNGHSPQRISQPSLLAEKTAVVEMNDQEPPQQAISRSLTGIFSWRKKRPERSSTFHMRS